MYSRTQSSRSGGIRVPEHYSGVAFGRVEAEQPDFPRSPGYCADGLPGSSKPAPPSPEPEPVNCPPPPACPPRPDIARPPKSESPDTEGFLGGLGQEELLLLGIMFLLAQRGGEDDTILLLLLLLLRR